jgi:hypothetical protein
VLSGLSSLIAIMRNFFSAGHIHFIFIVSFPRVYGKESIGVSASGRIPHLNYLKRGIHDHEIPPTRCSNWRS